MDEKLKELEKILEPKVDLLVEAIERADATTPKYKDLLGNLDTTLAFLTNIQLRNFQPYEGAVGEFAVEEKVEPEII